MVQIRDRVNDIFGNVDGIAIYPTTVTPTEFDRSISAGSTSVLRRCRP